MSAPDLTPVEIGALHIAQAHGPRGYSHVGSPTPDEMAALMVRLVEAGLLSFQLTEAGRALLRERAR